MSSILDRLVDPAGLTPHGFCLAWEPGLIWLEAASDVLIACAYFSIPLAMMFFVRRRQDLPFPWIIWLFVGFITACGMTHVFGAATLWVPAYWPDGLVKALTAALSLTTAVLLWPLIPRALALPSPAELEIANARLRREAEIRKEVTRKLLDSEAALRAAERREAAARLAKAEGMLSAFGEACPDLLFAKDRNGRYLYANPATLEAIGRPAPEVIGHTDEEFPFRPIEAQTIAENDRRIMASGVWETLEETATDFSRGESRLWQATKAPLRDPRTGEIIGLIGVARDVTEARRAERAVAESEARFRATFDRAAVGVAELGLDGRWLRVNRRLCDMLGYTEAQLLTRGWSDVTNPEGIAANLAGTRHLFAGEDSVYMTERRFRRQDGSAICAAVTVSLVRDGAGHPDYFVAIIEDISERKAAEAALADSRARLEELLATLELSMVMVRDFDGTIRFWPKGCERLYGWTAEEAIGRNAHELLHTVFPVSRADTEASLLRDGEWVGNLRHRTRDGREIVVAARKVLRREGDQPIAIMESLRDLTELNRAEDELRRLNEELGARVREEVATREATLARLDHARRMEALGQLAGGIAHDFNNVLQAVHGGASLICRDPEKTERNRRLARTILHAAERGMGITSRLLVFSRQGDLRPEPVQVPTLLDAISEILSHTLGRGIEVKVDAPPDLLPLVADRSQLETALVNLATNARDAMAGNGTLTFGARPEIVAENGNPALPIRLSPGSYIRLSVSDTGCGMDSETLGRALEPFFTTKPVGGGTGLGLSMARGFVEQSGGGLHIQSKPGQGTTVTLWLPATTEPAPETARSSEDRRSQSDAAEARRVLVVDDEDLVREIICDQLEAASYAVVPASSGAEALALLDSGEEVSLILSDLSMPGMDGIALIREAQRRRPGLPAILLTGFATRAAELSRMGAAGEQFSLMLKPSSGEDLADRIALLIGTAHGNSHD